MGVKERIIALKLIKKKEHQTDYMNEIGVDAKMIVNTDADHIKTEEIKKPETLLSG